MPSWKELKQANWDRMNAEPAQKPEREHDACTHHWLLADRPVNGKFPSTCKHCGAEKDFPSRVDDYTWDQIITAQSGYWKGHAANGKVPKSFAIEEDNGYQLGD